MLLTDLRSLLYFLWEKKFHQLPKKFPRSGECGCSLCEFSWRCSMRRPSPWSPSQWSPALTVVPARYGLLGMAGNWWSKTLRRFIDRNVIENKYEFMCNSYPGVFMCDRLPCGRWIDGGKFLASEEYGDKMSSKCSFQTLNIKCFYLICFWSQTL